ncbi:hypothetical protein [Actinoplanes awajinensis]|uniref:Uncharacterized protein n=1 Tax=Actinoplanes awajinensis subsp. mycoplanecinus TaxID=135947 RepID=A0A0X3VCF7_9ACTN|nr:hypothetical protein [Actinoplanes awajinensis]KUL42425.1 hypothetical protein ADL15_00670 [Actinoplanes awajinensis subsp. mycoplanecinus]
MPFPPGSPDRSTLDRSPRRARLAELVGRPYGLALLCLFLAAGCLWWAVDVVREGDAAALLALPFALLGMLLFGGGLYGCVAEIRRDRPPATDRPVTTVRNFAGWVERRDLVRVRRLAGVLQDTPGWLAPAELAELGRCPDLLDALFFHARRGDLAAELRISADRVRAGAARRPDAEGSDAGVPGALDVVLATLDRDGRVREAAVRRMAAELLPGQEWFLVERAVDHVAAIRAVALTAIEEWLVEDRERVAPVLRQAFRRVAGRDRAVPLSELLERRGPDSCRDGGLTCRGGGDWDGCSGRTG